jgi:hypothetical protein
MASPGVKLTGGSVRPESRQYPPHRPPSAHTGTPDCCSAPMSRSMVRALTSNLAASQRALRGRGATARSSSTRAYNRSVRFTLATLDAATDIPRRGSRRWPAARVRPGWW